MDSRWLLGFIEGEGCFSVGFIRQKGTPFGYQIKAMFIIKITESEKKVLEKIRSYLGGIGNIYFESCELNRTKGMINANDSVSFRVTHLEELEKIIGLLKKEEFVSEQKRLDFKNWVRCISILKNKKHLTKKGFLEIAYLRSKMHKRKQSNKKGFCEIKNEIEPCEIYKKFGKSCANLELNKCLLGGSE